MGDWTQTGWKRGGMDHGTGGTVGGSTWTAPDGTWGWDRMDAGQWNLRGWQRLGHGTGWNLRGRRLKPVPSEEPGDPFPAAAYL